MKLNVVDFNNYKEAIRIQEEIFEMYNEIQKN